MKKSWFIVCLINFFIASLMGAFLRLSQLTPLPFDYTFLLHGHSHTAILGWLYLVLYGLLLQHFVPEKEREKPYYNRLFWLTQGSVFGMMVSFPIQGYALFSIFFSTAHIFCSYYFCYKIWKEQKSQSASGRKLLKAALVFMLVSTAGVWSLGIIGATGVKNPAVYQSAIQFFLHFQFNGWFLFAVLALLFNQPDSNDAAHIKKFHYFFNLLILATILTLGLPLNWYFPNAVLYWSNAAGVLLQFIALLLFYQLCRIPLLRYLQDKPFLIRLLAGVGLISLLLKIALQCFTIWNEIAEASHYIRNFTIGFIHLLMLGIINSAVFLFAAANPALNFLNNKKSQLGLFLFLSGFLATEILLFLQGSYFFFGKGAIPNYTVLLFSFSLLLPLGLIVLLLKTLKKNKP